MPPFRVPLWRWPGPGGIIMVTVPEGHAPPPMAPFGRCPVVATIDGKRWATSVWHSKEHGSILLIPKKVRRAKVEGDFVDGELEMDLARI
jgi:hypothetical protein